MRLDLSGSHRLHRPNHQRELFHDALAKNRQALRAPCFFDHWMTIGGGKGLATGQACLGSHAGMSKRMTDCWSLSTAISQLRSSMSIPIARRPMSRDALSAVPLPIKGSETIPLGPESASIRIRNGSIGFCAGCSRWSLFCPGDLPTHASGMYPFPYHSRLPV